jgi:hypothetical protein
VASLLLLPDRRQTVDSKLTRRGCTAADITLTGEMGYSRKKTF